MPTMASILSKLMLTLLFVILFYCTVNWETCKMEAIGNFIIKRDVCISLRGAGTVALVPR